MNGSNALKTAGPHRQLKLRARLTDYQQFIRMERIIGRARKQGRIHRADNRLFLEGPFVP